MIAIGHTTVARERRRLIGGAASLCLAVLLAACGPFLPPDASPPGGPTSGPSGSAVPSFAGTPAERLASALTALGAGYTFETTLRVGEQIAARVVGRRLGAASELEIESGGATVTDRLVPPGAWLMEADSAWVEADGSVPDGDPLAPLLQPVTVAAGAGGSGEDRIEATYPATALGLEGGDPVSVAISIAPGGIVTARYETVVDGRPAVSETVLTPAATQDPILAPSPIASPAS